MTADDKFLPVTSEFIIATKSRTRYFDLDAVRGENVKPIPPDEVVQGWKQHAGSSDARMAARPGGDADGKHNHGGNPAGAPPLDWWKDSAADVIGRLIKSMCPEKVCTLCGLPSRRILVENPDAYVGEHPWGGTEAGKNLKGTGHPMEMPPKRIGSNDWSDCGHNSWRPGVTFDPFAQVIIERTEDGMTSRFIIGDTREVLAAMPDNSVDLIISSPPFLALRSYLAADHPDKGKEIGSEATPGLFLDTLLDIVEECARVLTPHGSLCIELGDTFSGSGGAGGDYGAEGMRAGAPGFEGSALRMRQSPPNSGAGGDMRFTVDGKGGSGWPLDKSLCLIPQSFAWALSYGRNPFTGRETERWRVRNIVRWCRPNPPVGALGDKFRPATSEMVVACKARDRYFDLDAVRTEHKYPETATLEGAKHKTKNHAGANPSTGWTSESENVIANPAGAPPLDWWEIPTQPYKGSHYATWPERLLDKPIRSMCPERVCTICGEPSRRIVRPTEYDAEREDTGRPLQSLGSGHRSDRPAANPETLGWTDCPCTCPDFTGDGDYYTHDCKGKWRRGVVLDIFAGSGTTLAVAEGLGRDSIGIDLDARNADLAQERCGMFLSVEYPDSESVA